jgi:hypothetical protein
MFEGSRMMVLYLGLAGAAGGGWRGWEIFGEDYVLFVTGIKKDTFSKPWFRVEAHSCCLSSLAAEKALDDSFSLPCDADGFPFRLTNVSCVWILVAILAEQAHVVHSFLVKVLA